MISAKAEVERLAAVVQLPIDGNYDLEHLQAIHRYLFSNSYPAAGKLRTAELKIGTTRFVKPKLLDLVAKGLFEALQLDGLLRHVPHEVYIEHLAHYYSEINILHPFRKGNGLAQRAFFTMLAAESGRYIAWDQLDAAENTAACIQAYNGDESGLVKLLSPLVKRLQ